MRRRERAGAGSSRGKVKNPTVAVLGARLFLVVAGGAFPLACSTDPFAACMETRTCPRTHDKDSGAAEKDAAQPKTGTGGATNGGSAGAVGASGGSGLGNGGAGQVGGGGSAGAKTETTTGGGPSTGTRDAGIDAADASSPDASGDGGGAPSVCDPSKSPSVAACAIDEAYGVFVSPNGSDASGDGSRLRPVSTLTKGIALAHAAGKRVFACATQGSFKEALTIDAKLDGLALYGGFDCATWTYSTSTPSVVASPKSIALTMQNLAAGIHVEDFSFQAAAGASAGESSIAALVAQSQKVAFVRVTLKASAGVAGADGTGIASAAADGVPGFDSRQVCSGIGTYGYVGYETACGGVANGSVGGNPGDGDASGPGGPPAGDGGDGKPTGPSGGKGGAKQTATTPCTDGTAGVDGTSRSPGKGGGLGALSATGYQPATGAAGLDGTVGQGGGGGGGRIANVSCDNGASGGGGGSGGCPGRGGTGGKGGGASIALGSISSSIALDGCALIAVAGGAGGRGGLGQPGGAGGNGGERTTNSNVATDLSCAGGKGGNGGNGGHGGGGAGGPSIGIASIGTAPGQTNTTIRVADVSAPGGADGGGAKTGNSAGATGLVANAYDF